MQNTNEKFLTQAAFCRTVGISQTWARVLRERGVLPSFGTRPVYIPLAAGTAAISKYASSHKLDSYTAQAD